MSDTPSDIPLFLPKFMYCLSLKPLCLVLQASGNLLIFTHLRIDDRDLRYQCLNAVSNTAYAVCPLIHSFCNAVDRIHHLRNHRKNCIGTLRIINHLSVNMGGIITVMLSTGNKIIVIRQDRALHITNDLIGIVNELANQINDHAVDSLNVACRLLAGIRQLANLIRNNCKTLSCLSCSGSLDGSIQR